MLSYKQWHMLNESFAGTTALGVTSPASIGAVGSLLQDLEDISEMKKKKMDLDLEDLEDDDDDEDGEMVKPSAKKDDPDVEMDDTDMDDDIDDDGDDEGELEFSKKNCKKSEKNCSCKSSKKSKKKMLSDMDDVDPDDDGDEEMDMGDEDVAGDSPCAGGDDDGDMDMDLGDGDDEMDDMDMKMSKKKSKKSSKKSKKKMCDGKVATEEGVQDPWWSSLKNQLSGTVNDQKFGDGWTEYQDVCEDALLAPPEEPVQAEQQPEEPQPGEVGFAPQQMGATAGGSWFA